MNRHLLDGPVQEYIRSRTAADVHLAAMSKSPFPQISGPELAGQIASRQKAKKKLPLWYNTPGIYFPPSISIEQSSSEVTAAYKAELARGNSLIDLTGGFGVDSYYFSLKVASVTHCELNPELSEIAAHNAVVLGRDNVRFVAGDGLTYLASVTGDFATLYIDPARRGETGKVFRLSDCTPDVTTHLDLLLKRSSRLIIKTSPLLDIVAGLKELRQVSEIHIVSVRNECRELLWVIDKETGAENTPELIAVTLNAQRKVFRVVANSAPAVSASGNPYATEIGPFLYEPDAGLLKSGAFDEIGTRYSLRKLHPQTQLYTGDTVNTAFPGRIFKVARLLSSGELKASKREEQRKGNVLVRNYPDRAELLVKKYRISPDQERFFIFTKSTAEGLLIIEAEILQHY